MRLIVSFLFVALVSVAAAADSCVNSAPFERVQAAHRKRKQKKSDKRLLDQAKRVLAKKGKLSQDLLSQARGVSSKSTYVLRFGSIRRVYELVGYQPSAQALAVSLPCERTWRLRNTLVEEIEALYPERVKRILLPGHGNRRPALRLDGTLTVSVLLRAYYKTPAEGRIRWELIPKGAERDFVTLVCLLNSNNDGFLGFYVFPRMDHATEYQIEGESDPWLGKGKRLGSLAELYEVARSVKH